MNTKAQTVYDRLTDDLRFAIEAAQAAAAASDDGGTCNIDSLVVILKGANAARFEAAAKAAGALYASRYHPGEFLIGIPTGGQANRRMRAVEAARDAMKAAGWRARVHYQNDEYLMVIPYDRETYRLRRYDFDRWLLKP